MRYNQKVSRSYIFSVKNINQYRCEQRKLQNEFILFRFNFGESVSVLKNIKPDLEITVFCKIQDLPGHNPPSFPDLELMRHILVSQVEN